jgi:transposase
MAAPRCETGVIEGEDSALPPQPTLLAGSGYDADWLRELAARKEHGRTVCERNRKDSICFSPNLYHACSQIERFCNTIKQWWRVATQYDKLAASYLALVKIASIRIWLCANKSTP